MNDESLHAAKAVAGAEEIDKAVANSTSCKPAGSRGLIQGIFQKLSDIAGATSVPNI